GLARLYYQAARQRAEDASMLLEGARTTGAVYLAGYAVECMLKALLLANVARGLRNELLKEFHGRRAHDIEWLGNLCRRHVGVAVPLEISRHLARLATWSTDLRYHTGALRKQDADRFLASVRSVTTWADGRM